jgi:hypothetical protein
MTMTFDEAGEALAQRVRATGRGYLTMRREELREVFGIGRLTEGQSNAACEALGRQGLFVFPHPFESGPVLRLYDQKHLMAGVAEAVARPDAIPDTPLRRAAEIFARESAGRDLRSDDAPWLLVFDLFLQVVLGREPEGWEDLRDDRHPSELARELATALGFPPTLSAEPSTLRLAAAVCSFRPRRRQWLVSELLGVGGHEAAILPLIDGLASANRRLRDEHERLLQQAARLLLGVDELPSRPVELGIHGLRFRREDVNRSAAQ